MLRYLSKNPSQTTKGFFSHLICRSPLLLLSIFFFFFFQKEIAFTACIFCLFLYIYQSFDSLITYHLLFLRQLVAETIGFAIIVSGFFLAHTPTVQSILWIYCVGFLIKIIIMIPALRLEFNQILWNLDWTFLKKSTPFFLIGLSGYLSSKIDLYVATIHLSSERLAEYQILVTSFLMFEALAGLIVYPIVKHLYRLPMKKIEKIKKKIWVLGLTLVIPSTIAIWIFLEKIVGLDSEPIHYLIGALLSLPIYFYIIDIIIYYKLKQEQKVMQLNFLAVSIKLIGLSFLIIFLGTLKVTGFLLTLLFTNVLMLLLYKTRLFK